MGQKLGRISAATIVMVCATFLLSPRASAQATVTLQDQLAAQYKVVKMGSDTSGYSVIDAGTLLEIKKGGILGVPYSDTSILSTKYESGTVHTPSSMLSKGIGFGMKRFGKEQTTKLFPVGNKVYPSKIDVDTGKDIVTLSIVACDTCNKTDPPSYNKAKVVFQFPKGSLAKASAGDVEDTIGQLLSISDDSQSQDQGGQQQGQGGGQGGQGGQGNGDQQAADQGQQQQAEPQTIEKGQTTDQVQAALGKPEKIVNLGTKQIYIYKDMKVTFLNGKVSDVQ
ncbi:MAG TPA: hypothetical protein VMQ17_02595 [Candidatus Sulfotelmatobacter sp.]|jgi:hypothetical protein|nr:hypothetical protein [Candidatus Sulfotelmatobacter sp.]